MGVQVAAMINRVGKFLYTRVPKLKSVYHYMIFYYYFLKRPKVPSSLFIESTNACNYKCIMCPMQTMKRKFGLMKFSLYKKIIDEATEMGVPRIRPQFYGEPLLHPKIINMVKYAKERSLNVGFDTNAELLNTRLSKQLMNAGLDWVLFSFHGLTPAEYRNVHGRNSFHKAVKNIKTFHRIRDEIGATLPKTTIQTTIMDKNFKNVHKVFSIFGGVADKFSITNCDFHPATMKKDFRLLKFDYNRKIPCSSLFTMLAISWDGKATVCCSDQDFKLSIGHVNEGLRNLWNSKKLNRYRRLHMFGKFEKMPLCSKCIDPVTASSYIKKDLRARIIEGKIKKKIIYK